MGNAKPRSRFRQAARTSSMAGMQEFDVRPLKPRSRETAGHIRSRVDANAKAEILGVPCRRVAVNDHPPAKDISGGQELVAYPEPVRFGLAIQRYARPHARVHKMIITAVIAQGKRAQEIVACPWKH